VTITVDSILENALCLSSESRLKIAERLIESVEPDKSLLAEQVAVVLRRDAEMDAGTATEIPLSDALLHVRESVIQMAGT
jgi:hypothetical protein